MRHRTVGQALELVGPGATAVASPGCGTPETLLTHLGARAAEVGSVTLLSGLQLGAYPFLDTVAAGVMQYRTWHMTGAVREAAAAGHVHYLPARASEIPRLLLALRPDVALIRVTPPDRNGYCSLGPSVSYSLSATRAARITIAEVDDTLPWTHGESTVHMSAIDALVAAETPTCVYRPPPPSAVALEVASEVMRLLPANPTIQVGIGAVPEALTSVLAEGDVGTVRFVGMGTDGMVDLFDRGLVDARARVPLPALTAAELMGTERLLRFAHQNPAIGVYPSSRSHDPRALGTVDRLVSVNSAICVDLSGQVCSERSEGAAAGAVGGSFDYAEAAYGSSGGLRVIALPSMTRTGAVSRIVTALDASAPVSIPRHSVDAVVTEHGVAWLSGRTLEERAIALAAIADPRHREELEATGRSPADPCRPPTRLREAP